MEWKMKLKISYSRVQISSDEVFSKIMKKPSIFVSFSFIEMKQKNVVVLKKENQKWPTQETLIF